MINKNYSVLTGDVINSRNLSSPQLEAVFSRVRGLWKEYGEVHVGVVVGGFEVFRGDGWQAAIADPARCVEAAIFLRAAFRAQPGKIRVDSRICSYRNPVEFRSRFGHRLHLLLPGKLILPFFSSL